MSQHSVCCKVTWSYPSSTILAMTAGETSSLMFFLASCEEVSARTRSAMWRMLLRSSWRKTTTSSSLFSSSGRKYACTQLACQLPDSSIAPDTVTSGHNILLTQQCCTLHANPQKVRWHACLSLPSCTVVANIGTQHTANDTMLCRSQPGSIVVMQNHLSDQHAKVSSEGTLSSSVTRECKRLYWSSSGEALVRANPRDLPPPAMALLPTLLVMTTRQFLKETVRPVLSVRWPSSSTCARIAPKSAQPFGKTSCAWQSMYGIDASA